MCVLLVAFTSETRAEPAAGQTARGAAGGFSTPDGFAGPGPWSPGSYQGTIQHNIVFNKLRLSFVVVFCVLFVICSHPLVSGFSAQSEVRGDKADEAGPAAGPEPVCFSRERATLWERKKHGPEETQHPVGPGKAQGFCPIIAHVQLHILSPCGANLCYWHLNYLV